MGRALRWEESSHHPWLSHLLLQVGLQPSFFENLPTGSTLFHIQKLVIIRKDVFPTKQKRNLHHSSNEVVVSSPAYSTSHAWFRSRSTRLAEIRTPGGCIASSILYVRNDPLVPCRRSGMSTPNIPFHSLETKVPIEDNPSPIHFTPYRLSFFFFPFRTYPLGNLPFNFFGL